mmetsp:Transcript_14772/g.43372  ORF Transcript_14772/g.43372 Transcript_14772/m.43372 type:complete len:223 (+) Transcript_14772:47-715(+)
MCLQDESNYPPEYIRLHKFCIALLFLAVLSLIGFAINGFGGIGGLFATIGASLVVCCGPRLRGFGQCQLIAQMCLFIIAAIFHTVGVAVMIETWVVLNEQFDRLCEARANDPSFNCEDQRSAFFGAIGIILWPAVAIVLLCIIMELPAVYMAYQAKRVIDATPREGQVASEVVAAQVVSNPVMLQGQVIGQGTPVGLTPAQNSGASQPGNQQGRAYAVGQNV